jgi:hypothetical protein
MSDSCRSICNITATRSRTWRKSSTRRTMWLMPLYC